MCTFNMIVNGEQTTVQFYVDNMKVLYKDLAVLEDILGDLRDEFGQEDKLTENKGLIREYLGITTDYWIADKVLFVIFIT